MTCSSLEVHTASLRDIMKMERPIVVVNGLSSICKVNGSCKQLGITCMASLCHPLVVSNVGVLAPY